MKLSFIRVSKWDQALELLDVRNQCREGMTHTTKLLTEEQQAKFFAEQIVPGHIYECYLLKDGAQAAGYGLLKRDGNRKWMSAGLARPYRGRHLSRLLISLITEIAYVDPGIEVWIDVWNDNLALIGDLKVGYQLMRTEIQDDGRVLRIMRHQRDRILGLDENALLTQAQTQHLVAEMHEVAAIADEFYS